MSANFSKKYQAEGRLVAELRRLGIRYLAYPEDLEVHEIRPIEIMLTDLVKQPSSRVRTPLIPLMIEHPEYATFVSLARSKVRGPRRTLLEVYYTAAVFLQRKYKVRVVEIKGAKIEWLPDLFSKRLDIPEGLSPEESLKRLATRQQELSGSMLNWAGTYDNAVQHWLRRREKEMMWGRQLFLS